MEYEAFERTCRERGELEPLQEYLGARTPREAYDRVREKYRADSHGRDFGGFLAWLIADARLDRRLLHDH